jgi:hypothetical protein
MSCEWHLATPRSASPPISTVTATSRVRLAAVQSTKKPPRVFRRWLFRAYLGVDLSGLEPLTFRMRTERSPN